jgi:hypothetical protein
MKSQTVNNKKPGGPMTPLNEAGIHPSPPGAAAIGAQLGTRGAPVWVFTQLPTRFFGVAINYRYFNVLRQRALFGIKGR